MSRKLFVITGPSGIGKSYLMTTLLGRYPDRFEVPKLLTTRAARPGEQAIDREFISEEQFTRMAQNGEFAWTDSFYDNHYGYTQQALQPSQRHILINALPPMIEEFANLPHAVVVGLTVLPENFELIKRRLELRGDPADAVFKRLSALSQDVAIMQDVQGTIAQHGKLFEIVDNDSVETVVDWLRYNYLDHEH
jgi:guanylate kinase